MGAKRSTERKSNLFALPTPESMLGNHYSCVTLRPWPSLVFLLPALIFFEVGICYSSHDAGGGNRQLVAVYLIERMVESLGAGRFGYIFPGLALVAILLSWHLAARHPWRYDPFVWPGMLGESLMWTIPLFGLNRIFHQFNLVLHEAVLPHPGHLSGVWFDQVVRSVGAGLYEELVFRLICITGLDILLVNVCRFSRSASCVFSVLASSALFSAQHHPPLGADLFEMTNSLFRTAAGVYLAGLFLYRGFGIAAGCHVLYNVIVVTLGALRGL